MRTLPSWVLGIVAASLAAAFAWWLMPLRIWKPAIPSLLVALSMLGAAVLVRMARNVPISSPTAFDEADLKAFFDALENLATRLFAIFVQVVALVVVVIGCSIALEYSHLIPDWNRIDPILSSSLAFLLVWVFSRLIAMVHGDIGFVRLQRRVLENALKRTREAEAAAKAEQPVAWKSGGGYGRALGA